MDEVGEHRGDARRTRAWGPVVALTALLVGNWWLYELRTVLSPAGLAGLTDFDAYHLAGKAFLAGLNPYLDNSSVGALADARGWHPGFSSYLYPPAFLPGCALLARIPLDLAKVAWTLGLIALHAVVVLSVASSLPKERRPAFVSVAGLLTLISHPFLVHLQRGQIDLLVASLSVLALLCYGKWRSWPSAALLATAACIKINPAFLVVGFVAAHRSAGFAVKFLTAAAAIVAASLIVVPAELYGFYLREVLPWLSAGNPSYQNQALVRFVAGANPLWAALLSGAGIGGFTVLAVRWGWTLRSRSARHGHDLWPLFLANVLAMLIFSSISWHMAYVWTIVPLAATVALVLDRMQGWEAALLGLAGVLLHGRIEQHIPVVHATNLIGAVIGFAVLCVWLARTPPVTEAHRAA